MEEKIKAKSSVSLRACDRYEMEEISGAVRRLLTIFRLKKMKYAEKE